MDIPIDSYTYPAGEESFLDWATRHAEDLDDLFTKDPQKVSVVDRTLKIFYRESDEEQSRRNRIKAFRELAILDAQQPGLFDLIMLQLDQIALILIKGGVQLVQEHMENNDFPFVGPTWNSPNLVHRGLFALLTLSGYVAGRKEDLLYEDYYYAIKAYYADRMGKERDFHIEPNGERIYINLKNAIGLYLTYRDTRRRMVCKLINENDLSIEGNIDEQSKKIFEAGLLTVLDIRVEFVKNLKFRMLRNSVFQQRSIIYQET